MKLLSICLGFVLLMSACSQDQQSAEKAPAAVNAAVSEVDHLTDAYFELKDALVASDSQSANARAVALQKMLETATVEHIGPLLASIKSIVAAKDLAEQRQAFLPLSLAMVKMVKDSERISNEVYVQHCPMAFDNTGGDWLSDSENILNPYYGDAMLKCGYIKETLAAK